MTFMDTQYRRLNRAEILQVIALRTISFFTFVPFPSTLRSAAVVEETLNYDGLGA
jgi:hypothetical protein